MALNDIRQLCLSFDFVKQVFLTVNIGSLDIDLHVDDNKYLMYLLSGNTLNTIKKSLMELLPINLCFKLKIILESC